MIFELLSWETVSPYIEAYLSVKPSHTTICDVTDGADVYLHVAKAEKGSRQDSLQTISFIAALQNSM